MDDNTRILLVEDSLADAELNKREARKVLENCSFKLVETEEAFLEELKNWQPHLILSDYSMPVFDGLSALALALKYSPETPVIIVTGSVNEDTAVECMKAGAANYVIKQSIKRLGTAILHALEERIRKIDHRRSQIALSVSEKRYRELFEISPLGIVVQDARNIILNINKAYCEISGYSAEQLLGKNVSILCLGSLELDNIKSNTSKILSGEILRHEVMNLRKDGLPIVIELTESPITLEDGSTGILSMAADITERKSSEKELEFMNRNLQFLSDYALMLTGVTENSDFTKVVVDALKRLTGAELILFSEYNSKNSTLITRHILVNQEIEKKMTGLLGKSFLQLSLPVSPQIYKHFLEHSSQTFSSLTELSFGVIPESINQAFLELSHINRYIGISFNVGEEVYGTAIIGLKPEQPDPDEKLLNSLAHLTSLNMRRKKAEEELKEREERLYKIVNSSQDAMVIMNETGNAYIWNQSAQRMFGYTAEEISGKNLYNLIMPNHDQEQFKGVFDNTQETGESSSTGKTIESAALRKSGEEFPVELVLSAIKIDDEWYSIASIRDITERKRAIESILSNERKYHNLFDANINGIAVIRINPDETVTTQIQVNKAAANMLGYTPEELTALPMHVLEANITPEILEERRNALGRNSSHIFETLLIHKSGKLIPVEISGTFINYDGVPAIMNIMRDISERKFRENLQKMQYNIANAVINANSLHTMYEAVRDELSNIIDTTNFFVAFYNEETGMMQSPFEQELDIIEEWPADKSLSGYIVNQKKSLLLTKSQISEMAEKGIINLIGTRSEKWLGVPLFSGKQAIGAMVVQSYDNPNAYNEDSKYVLELAAHELGNYISRKEAEQHAIKLSKAVEQNPVSIVITDKEGKIEYVNPKFIEVTGYSFAESVGMKPSILKSGEQDKTFYEHLWNTISAGADWQGEIKNKKKDGKYYWENAIISPIFDEKGAITNFVAVKEDITEKKNIIRELSIAKDKAEESDRLKTAFLQNISHEIRTPLNGILGFSELLIQEWTSPEERIEYSEAINLSGKRLIEIISNVLDISIIETGQVILNPVSFRLNQMMLELNNFYHNQALQKGLELKYKMGETDENSLINADHSRINQVLTNLLNNAIKYTKKGNINFSYKFLNAGEVLFSVTDTGIGINEAHHNRIFTRFYQANSSNARNYEGAGLGLSISQGLVQAMGGKIWFESEPGIGSSFYFTIPLSGFQIQSEDPISDIAIHQDNEIVLIADDDYTSFKLLQTTLKKRNLKVIRAETGLEAVEMVKKYENIMLVLMDVKMPEMDGFEATRIIKSLKPGLPVIIQTAYAFKDDTEKAFAFGCDDFLSKPIATDKLYQIFEKYMGKKS